jgi:hypothetical protein
LRRTQKPKQKDCLPVTRGHWGKPAFKTTWNRSGNSNIWLAIFSGSLKALLRADPDLFFANTIDDQSNIISTSYEN